MIARCYSVAFQGVEAREVDVQCRLASGLPAFNIVGLPDKAVAESKERVRAALGAIGLGLPPSRITINLAPADMPKEGAHFDLPIALAVLAAMEVIPTEETAGIVAMGELALDGAIGWVAGVLPAALAAAEADRIFVCPASCGPEAAISGGTEVVAPGDLISLVNHLAGRQALAPPEVAAAEGDERIPDMADIRGQERARRALEVAAAGGHNMLMIGPPGAGKSMLAKRLPGILPPLSPTEALEVSMVHSVAGLIEEGRLPRVRPFRDPHHSASMPAMVGGGRKASPGEVSLAHNGVLFLDELAEFPRIVLDSLRQPIETGEAVVARANAHLRYPARVQLIGAMNPCRCGHLADPAQACSRAPRCGQDYQSRISGPLMDRLDIQIELPAVKPQDLIDAPLGEPTAKIARRIQKARSMQAERYGETPGGPRTNAEIDGEALLEIARPEEEGLKLLSTAVEKLKLTARGYHRVLRLGRTIADLAGSQGVRREHVAEAIGYRRVPLAN